jgi:hypothetical protein
MCQERKEGRKEGIDVIQERKEGKKGENAPSKERVSVLSAKEVTDTSTQTISAERGEGKPFIFVLGGSDY